MGNWNCRRQSSITTNQVVLSLNQIQSIKANEEEQKTLPPSRKLALDGSNPTGNTVYISHGPCMDGMASLSIPWRLMSTSTKDMLIKRGHLYAPKNDDQLKIKTKKHGPFDNALNLLEDESIPDQMKKVFVTCQPQVPIPPKLLIGPVVVMDLDVGADNLHLFDRSHIAVTIIDHHASFADSVRKFLDNKDYQMVVHKVTKLTDNIQYFWNPDKTHSGVSLTWEFFHPGEPMPEWLRCIQIGDTWNWKQASAPPVDEVKAYLEALYIREASSHLTTFCSVTEQDYASLMKEGQSYLRMKDQRVKALAHKTTLGYIRSKDSEGKSVTYNVLYTSIDSYWNEVAWYIWNHLPQNAPDAKETKGPTIHFVANWNYKPQPPVIPNTEIETKDIGKNNDPIITVSMRCPLKGIDLSVVARNVEGTISGGGHPPAAAFAFKGIENFHKFILNVKP